MEEAIKAPSRWYYVIIVTILVVGFTLFALFLFTQITTIIPQIQVVVPGTHEIYLEKPGKYMIFYEYRSIINSKIYSTGEPISGMSVTIRSKKDSQEIPLSKPSTSSTYEAGGRAGVSVFKFEIEEPGTYILTARYSNGVSGPDIVLAIGQFKLLGAILGGIGILSGVLISGFIIIRTLLKRQKARE